jgi:Septum formation initiator
VRERPLAGRRKRRSCAEILAVATRRAPARSKKKGKKSKRPQRTTVLLRWCLVGVAVFVGYLYFQPLSSYFETRSALNARTAEVVELRAERARLAKRLEDSATTQALAREARLQQLVRPGERLFIVKGVKEWRRANARKQRATVEGDG